MDSVIPSAPAKSTKVDFDWADPFGLESQLSSEDRLVRDTAKAYAEDKLAPRVIEAFREEKTDIAIFCEMGELGLLGITVDERYGMEALAPVTLHMVLLPVR